MSIRVYPGAKNPTHEISLSDGVQKWGLRLDGGARAIQEIPMTASTLQFSGGGTKFGDWEPGMSHIEQRTWEGGRGQEEYVDDPTKFFDSMNAWTINGGKVFPAPQWQFATGLRQSCEHLPGNVDWQPLIGSKRCISNSFTTGDSAFPVERVYLWLRRIGSPGEVTAAIYTDDNDQPGTLVSGASSTIGVETVDDVISRWIGFDVSGCGSLQANTKYHLVVSGAETDGAANHWEVGIDRSGSGSLCTEDGINWSDAECALYYRVVDFAIQRKWQMFVYKQGLYAVDQRVDGTPSKLFLNGDRGKATGGTSSSITDTDKNWTTDEWSGAWVGITAGTGTGQRKQILSNTETSLTVEAWDISPDATSEYVIFNTAKWQDISPTSGDLIDGVVQDTVVIGDEVLFAQGSSANILRMRWNPSATPPAHEFADDGSNTADLLFPHVDTQNGLQVWRAKTKECKASKAPLANWGTAYVYGSDIAVGFNSEPITNLHTHNGNLYAFKTDGRYWIKPDETTEKSIGDIGFIPTPNNGEVLLSHGLYTYFSWGGYSLQRLYDSNFNYDLSSIGPDAHGGLPDERRGKIAALIGHPNGILGAIDGGEENISSVLMMPENNYGWHEIFRSWETGARIHNLFWQNIGDCRPRMWISVGGELVYQEWPEGAFNPLKDSGMNYCHEATLITSSIDMGAARLPKFLKEFSVLTENLTSGIEIHLDYQTDENIGSEDWIWAGIFHTHPEDSLPIQRGSVRKIRLRLRLVTNNSQIPPVIQATVLEGFTRTPLKYQWNMRVKVGENQKDLSGAGLDHEPDAFLMWLKEAATKAKAIHMRSIWEQMDNKYVIVEPPSLLRSFTNNLLGFWGGSVNITLRES